MTFLILTCKNVSPGRFTWEDEILTGEDGPLIYLIPLPFVEAGKVFSRVRLLPSIERNDPCKRAFFRSFIPFMVRTGS